MQEQVIATEPRGAGVYHEDVGMGETRQVQETKEYSDAGGGARDDLSSPTTRRLFPYEWGEIIQGGMQFAALIVAIIFGVWAIKSYDAAQKANAMSLLANQMSLVSLCAIGIFNQVNTFPLLPS